MVLALPWDQGPNWRNMKHNLCIVTRYRSGSFWTSHFPVITLNGFRSSGNYLRARSMLQAILWPNIDFSWPSAHGCFLCLREKGCHRQSTPTTILRERFPYQRGLRSWGAADESEISRDRASPNKSHTSFSACTGFNLSLSLNDEPKLLRYTNWARTMQHHYKLHLRKNKKQDFKT